LELHAVKLKDISERVSQLLQQSQELISTKKSVQFVGEQVDYAKLAGLRASVLSFIDMVYGKNHSHYAEFDTATNINTFINAQKSYEILRSIQHEIDGGWIFSLKSLISAEIFSDFIEMAEYLLEQGYKDPAAVVIGSVLEEGLRQLCTNNAITLEFVDGNGKIKFKKAETLNAELAKQNVYTMLDQKSVTMWLDLRNKAAHGKYSEYTKEQVNMCIQGVTDFLRRIN
jgi:hypothetical protein